MIKIVIGVAIFFLAWDCAYAQDVLEQRVAKLEQALAALLEENQQLKNEVEMLTDRLHQLEEWKAEWESIDVPEFVEGEPGEEFIEEEPEEEFPEEDPWEEFPEEESIEEEPGEEFSEEEPGEEFPEEESIEEEPGEEFSEEEPGEEFIEEEPGEEFPEEESIEEEPGEEFSEEEPGEEEESGKEFWEEEPEEESPEEEPDEEFIEEEPEEEFPEEEPAENAPEEDILPLWITTYDTEDPVAIGEQTIYVIELINVGETTYTNICLTDTVPGEMELVSAEGPTEYKVEKQAVIFNPIPLLGPKESAKYKIVCRTVREGTAVNVAQVLYDQFNGAIFDEEQTAVYHKE